MLAELECTLRVPPNVPAEQFWAVTVYDLESCAFLRDAARVELNSYDASMQRNSDGSVDIAFGPAQPKGRESNWISTAGKAVFDKIWKLPDIQKATAPH